MKKIISAYFVLFAAMSVASFFTSVAQAFPLPKAGLTTLQLPETFSSNFDFEGIVGLNNCSGSLIQLENSPDTDLALILTNGHCLETGFPKPGQVVYGKPSNRSFNVLDSRAKVLGSVRAREIVYSTMTNTDMTIYRLNESYASIKNKFNVRPLTLSSQHPDIGMPMEVISGYWKKGYSCTVEHFVYKLLEGAWTSVDSIRYSRPGCETIGGTSGSPVILKGTRTVIGVNNTGNEDGQKCTDNNPCEIDASGNITYQQGLSYGQQTYWVYTCLNQNRELDLSVAGCLLPK